MPSRRSRVVGASPTMQRFTSSGSSVTWGGGRLRVDARLPRTVGWAVLLTLTTYGAVPGITSLLVAQTGGAPSSGSGRTDADQPAGDPASSSTKEITCTGRTDGE